MNHRIVIRSLGIASVVLLLSSRYLDFVTGIPMVGTVSIAGESRLSWAGDMRFFSCVCLMAAALGFALFKQAKLSKIASWVDGLATGWFAAFAYGAIDWFIQQKELIASMGVNTSESGIVPGPGAWCFGGAAILWLARAITHQFANFRISGEKL